MNRFRTNVTDTSWKYVSDRLNRRRRKMGKNKKCNRKNVQKHQIGVHPLPEIVPNTHVSIVRCLGTLPSLFYKKKVDVKANSFGIDALTPHFGLFMTFLDDGMRKE